jgi:7-cyano-7-deazaguanine synthase
MMEGKHAQKSPNVVILYSGGLESTFLLLLASMMGLTPHCVLIDYGQKHIEELEKAIQFCTEKNLSHEIITLDWRPNSALTGNLTSRYEGVSEWYVPARNMMFISIAASIAETRGVETIWFGASYDDRVNLFPDCYQDWVVAINKTLELGLSKKVQVVAPLLGFTKEMVKTLVIKFGVDIEKEVFSGYGK